MEIKRWSSLAAPAVKVALRWGGAPYGGGPKRITHLNVPLRVQRRARARGQHNPVPTLALLRSAAAAAGRHAPVRRNKRPARVRVARVVGTARARSGGLVVVIVCGGAAALAEIVARSNEGCISGAGFVVCLRARKKGERTQSFGGK